VILLCIILTTSIGFFQTIGSNRLPQNLVGHQLVVEALADEFGPYRNRRGTIPWHFSGLKPRAVGDWNAKPIEEQGDSGGFVISSRIYSATAIRFVAPLQGNAWG
jgi:hypothetical protein